MGDERRDVVEHPPRLRLLDVQPGERAELARVVTGLDHPRLQADPVALEVGRDVHLVDVEAQVVERLDPLLDPPLLALGGVELRGPGQRAPQRVVPVGQQLDHVGRVGARVHEPAGLEVEELGEDVLGRDGEVVAALAVGELVVQLAGLRVDEVRRELAGAAPEQHVRQRHVTPEEPGQVQPDQQHHEGVDELREAVGPHPVGEQRAVGQGELQVPGDQGARQPLPLLVLASGHDRLGHDGRQADLLEVTQEVVLATGDELVGLLDRAGVLPDAHEPDHVPREAAGQLDHDLLRPLLQRHLPGQGHQLRIGLGGQDPHGHGFSLGVPRQAIAPRTHPGLASLAMRRVLAGSLLLALVTTTCVGTAARAGGPEDPVGGEIQLGKAAGLKYVAEQVTSDSNFEDLPVACGANNGPWHPTGGGVTMSDDASANSIKALRPMDLDAPLESPDDVRTDDYWEAAVGMAVGTQITAWTVCTKRKTGYVLVDSEDGTVRRARGRGPLS